MTEGTGRTAPQVLPGSSGEGCGNGKLQTPTAVRQPGLNRKFKSECWEELTSRCVMTLKSDPPGPSSPESGGRTALLSEFGERTRSVLGQLFTVPVKALSLHTGLWFSQRALRWVGELT